MKHLGWILGGWVGAGRGQPRRQLLWAFPSATTLWSVASALHVQAAVIVLHMGRTTQPERVGVVGGPEELGPEHFLEAFYFPLKLTFITGTMTFSS